LLQATSYDSAFGAMFYSERVERPGRRQPPPVHEGLAWAI
jgi:hypothetical protein